MSCSANNFGKVASGTTYIKQFSYGCPIHLWKTMVYKDLSENIIPVITTASPQYPNVYIPGDLIVNGTITTPSDIYLKDTISLIDETKTDKIMNLKPSSFTFKEDASNRVHYGFIAQEFENEFPELIAIKPDKDMVNIKGINYLEIIPLLVSKIQTMQKEIDELKERQL
jgi:hypothetical protein